MLENFYVITMISNPIRYASRYELYKKFAGMMKDAGVKLITIEIAFGVRPFAVTERDNPDHIQLRTIDELWHKENALNIAVQQILQLYPQALNGGKVAWIDADVSPMRPIKEWLEETSHALEHYEFVQMFETAIDLDPSMNMLGKPQTSFMAQYHKSGFQQPTQGGHWTNYYSKIHGHPGYAWAANLEALSKVGGFNYIEMAALGAGDRHLACSLVGIVEQSIGTRSPGYKAVMLRFQELCERHIKRDVGFVPGSIYHFWHGSKKDRGYQSRWQILDRNKFDPRTDLKKDSQGLFQLETWSPRQIRLRDEIRAYFRSRNEDDIRVD